MQELIVLSGKGGTGKTSITAGLAALAEQAVIVDCDVETPDLHLVLDPQPQQTEDFVGGNAAALRWDMCIGCGRCLELCRYGAILPYGPPNRFTQQTYVINARACEGCNVCAELCPAQAIAMVPAVNGQWHVSKTRHGPLVHARLTPGHGNSGKLVSLLRKEARALAERDSLPWVIGDGVPGVGCPVIASVGGADLALIVVEPSIAARHDLNRVIDLTTHFKVPAVLCCNRYDIDESLTSEIEAEARDRGVEPIGRVPYDERVVAAQVAATTIIEHDTGPVGPAVRALWDALQQRMEFAGRTTPDRASAKEST